MAENTISSIEDNSTVAPPRDTFVRRNFISECKDSRIIVEASFSPRIRRIYRRNFDGFSRSAYLIRFYSQIVRENGVETSLINEIKSLIESEKENLTEKIAVADQLLGNNNINVKDPQFEKINVTIIDPLANLFLQIFTVAQNLENKLNALWLACVLEEEHKVRAVNEMESGIQILHNKSRTLSLGLRDRARTQRLAREGATGADNVDRPTQETEQDVEAIRMGVVGVDIAENVEISTSPKRTKKASTHGAQGDVEEVDSVRSTDELLSAHSPS